MTSSKEEILQQISQAQPANEAEVETKIVLHLLRLLGYSDIDRADKVKVRMRAGRELTEKIADFILYNGAERALPSALLTVETKRIGESLQYAEEQARSYAAWAGTPFILVCNGEIILVAQFIPGSGIVSKFETTVREIASNFERLRSIVGRAEAVLAKERIAYISLYLPEVESLPPADFFREYLSRLSERFQRLRVNANPLAPPCGQDFGILQIPVTVRGAVSSNKDWGVAEVGQSLLRDPTFLFLEGAPGSGKSTLCRRIASTLADEAMSSSGDAFIPIFVNLGRGIPATVNAAFHRACEELGVRVFPELYKRVLTQGKVVLILDGLDEIPGRPSADLEISTLLCEPGIGSVLMTSRPGWRNPTSVRTKFRKLQVRPLTDDELSELINQYVRTPSKAKSLLSLSEEGKLPDLRSAMVALMAIRIANDVEDFEHLETFSLYTRYLETLHGYFNSQTVRGDSVVNAVTIDQLIETLACAAMICRNARVSGYQVSFSDLRSALTEVHSNAAIALFNCGLFTSNSASASFIHYSFEDFGVAAAMVGELRLNGIDALEEHRPTEHTYRIAASALTSSDEARLVNGIGHPKASVRKRVCGLLCRMHFSASAEKALWTQVCTERNKTIWSTIARALLRIRPIEFINWLTDHITDLSSSQLSSIAWEIRTSRNHELLETLLRAAAAKPSRHLAIAVFDLATEVDAQELEDQLVEIYEKLDKYSRFAIAELLKRRVGALRSRLAIRLIAIAVSLKEVINLLKCAPARELAENQGLLLKAIVIVNTTSSSLQLHRRDRRGLREVAKRLRLTPNPSDIVRDFADACELRGAKIGGEDEPVIDSE